MILMGIIKSIYSDRLLINLPGRMYGHVPITHISKSYTEFLQSTIEEEDLLDVSSLSTTSCAIYLILLIFIFTEAKNVIGNVSCWSGNLCEGAGQMFR